MRVLTARISLALTTAVTIVAGLLPQGAAMAHPLDSGNRRNHDDPTLVTTRSGPIRGTATASHRAFLGIPYAAPPVGDLRWTSPQPAQPWTATRDATAPGNDCAQAPGAVGPSPSTSEDCLYLNVTTPATDHGPARPVMVWFHGGSFTSGSGIAYGAGRLVGAADVMVVTVNYRLGALGFLAHPALDTPGSTAGAYGIEDQQAALRWVLANARAFGGDPGNVTIFGESAGAMSVCAHLAAPASRGLFHRAIIQSGPCGMSIPGLGSWTRPLDEARAAGIGIAQRLGCQNDQDAARCLRALPVADLIASTGDTNAALPFAPPHGGQVLPVAPATAIASGRFNRVPVIQGTNRDEQRLFLLIIEATAGHPLTEAEYVGTATAYFGDRAKTVLAEYPTSAYDGSPSLALSAMSTDAFWACPALDTARDLASHVPTREYEFADDHAPLFPGLPQPSFPTGAYHAAEVPYLFSGPALPDLLDAGQRRLSEQMARAWTRFAATGNPSGSGAPVWPRFSPSTGYVQALAPGPDGIARVDLAKTHRCDFWAEIGTVDQG